MTLWGQVLSCSHLPLPLAWAARNRLQPFKVLNYLPRETGLGKYLYLKVWGLKWELRFCHHGNPLKAMAFSERGPSVWSPPWSGWELQLCVGSFAFMSTARAVSGLFSLSTEDLYWMCSSEKDVGKLPLAEAATYPQFTAGWVSVIYLFMVFTDPKKSLCLHLLSSQDSKPNYFHNLSVERSNRHTLKKKTRNLFPS